MHTGRALLQMEDKDSAQGVIRKFKETRITVQHQAGKVLHLDASLGKKATFLGRRCASEWLTAVKNYDQLGEMPRLTIAADYQITNPHEEAWCEYCGNGRHSFEQCVVADNNFRAKGYATCDFRREVKGLPDEYHDSTMCPFCEYRQNLERKNSSRQHRWNNQGWVKPGAHLHTMQQVDDERRRK